MYTYVCMHVCERKKVFNFYKPLKFLNRLYGIKFMYILTHIHTNILKIRINSRNANISNIFAHMLA